MKLKSGCPFSPMISSSKPLCWRITAAVEPASATEKVPAPAYLRE
jgi:hypothetical protein